MRNRSLLVVVVVSLLGLSSAGCRKLMKKAGGGLDGSAGTALSAAPTPQWTDKRLKFQGSPGEVTFMFRNFDYTASPYGLPAGTKMEMGGESHTFGAFGGHSFSVRMVDTIAALAPRDALDYKFEVDPKQKVVFTFPGDFKVSVDAPKQAVRYGLMEAFKSVKNAPLSFGANDPAPAAHTIVYTGASEQVVGPAQTVREIDWVAVDEKQPGRPGKTCTGYKKTGAAAGGGESSFALEMQDSLVTIFDRKTSSPVDKKVFAAKNDCPMMAFSGKAVSYANTEEILRWLRERRLKK